MNEEFCHRKIHFKPAIIEINKFFCLSYTLIESGKEKYNYEKKHFLDEFRKRWQNLIQHYGKYCDLAKRPFGMAVKEIGGVKLYIHYEHILHIVYNSLNYIIDEILP